LRLCYTDEGFREEHFCLRAIQHTHASAFQARLRAAVTQAGIDHRLKFRHLAIVRTTAIPNGKATAQLVACFRDNGGLLLHPGEDELRTLWALWKLHEDNVDGLAEWLHHRKPVSKSTDSHTAAKDQPQSVMLGRQLIGHTVGVPIHVTLRRLSNHIL